MAAGLAFTVPAYATSSHDAAAAIAAEANQRLRDGPSNPLTDSAAAIAKEQGRAGTAIDQRVRALAEQITDQTREQTLGKMDQAAEAAGIEPASARPDESIYLFVSRSLGKRPLGSILAAIAGTPVTAVLRGIPTGTKINEAVGQIQALIRDRDITPPPQVIIDPTRWTDLGITSVPTMVMLRNDEEVARVRGITNPGWLKEQVEMGRTGDLGRRGPVEAPSEPDLIAVMKQRASQLDMATQKERAMKSYWEQVPFNELPAAGHDETRPVDLTILVQHDIKTPAGQVIAHRGQHIDPLDARPFTNRLIVFDATRDEQVRFAQRQVAEHDNVILMASRFDRGAGWDGLSAVEDQVDAPVFRLTHDVRSRFDVRATPSVIFAQSRHQVVIRQFAIQAKAE